MKASSPLKEKHLSPSLHLKMENKGREEKTLLKKKGSQISYTSIEF